MGLLSLHAGKTMFGPRDTRVLQARRDCKLAMLAAAVIAGYSIVQYFTERLSSRLAKQAPAGARFVGS